jgi:hypothetical protein
MSKTQVLIKSSTTEIRKHITAILSIVGSLFPLIFSKITTALASLTVLKQKTTWVSFYMCSICLEFKKKSLALVSMFFYRSCCYMDPDFERSTLWPIIPNQGWSYIAFKHQIIHGWPLHCQWTTIVRDGANDQWIQLLPLCAIVEVLDLGWGDIVVGDGTRWELLVGVATNNALCGKKRQEHHFDACLTKDGDEGIPLKVGTLQQHVLPPFRNIRCFSFVKLMYLDIF